MANRQRIRPSRAELTDDLDAALEAFHAEPSAKLYRGAPPSLGQRPAQPPQPPFSPQGEPLQVHEDPEPSFDAQAAPKKPQSKFKQMMAAKRQTGSHDSRPRGSESNKGANPLALIGEIQERSADSRPVVSVPEPTPSSQSPNFGFPLPARLENALDQEQDYAPSTANVQALQPEKRHFSSALEEAADADANAMLATMSPDDIRKEQQELREQLDPAFIDLLLSRRNKQQQPTTQDPVATPATLKESKPTEEAPQEIHPAASTSQAPIDPEAPLFDRMGHIDMSQTSSSSSTHAHDISSSKTLDAWLGQTRSAVSQQRANALSALSAIVRQQWMHKSILAAHLKLFSCATTCLATNSHLTVLSAATELLQAIHARTTASADPQGPERAQEILLTLESRDELSPLDALAKAFHPKSSSLPRPLKASASLFIESLVCSERTPDARKAVLGHPSLLQAMVQSAFSIQWPPSSDDPDEDPYPDLSVLRILHDLSRERAILETILPLRPVELLARFLVIPYWTLEQTAAIATAKALTSALMDMLSLWAVFGIGCELRASLAAVWTAFELHQWDFFTEHDVAASWFRLLRSWTTAATAPHETSPEHSIIWTQVDGWRELLQDAAEPVLAFSGEAYHEVQAEYLLAVSRFEKGRRKFNSSSQPLKVPSVNLSEGLAAYCREPNKSRAEWIFAAITALETYSSQDPRPLSQNADSAVDALQQNADACGRVTVPLLLQLSAACSNPLLRTVELCALCDASEVHYLSVFSTLAPSMSAQQGPKWVDVLRPFMTQTSTVSPFVPTAASFKRNETVPTRRGPPLGPCWFMDLPMNELFDSATSKILREVPNSYPYGEVEIASSALQAQLMANKMVRGKQDSVALPTREAMLYQLMRLFLLENHESRPGFFSSEVATVFRAAEVVAAIREALDFLPSLQSIGRWPVELHVLYAIYGDLLELYEAASFSDALFGSVVLLIALEPSTPADFRQLLFIEHSGILSSLQTSTIPLPSEAPEKDPESLRQLYLSQTDKQDSPQSSALRDVWLFLLNGPRRQQ